jgi:hypothetical protein
VKKISLLSMFGLAFMVVQVTNVGAQDQSDKNSPCYGVEPSERAGHPCQNSNIGMNPGRSQWSHSYS